QDHERAMRAKRHTVETPRRVLRGILDQDRPVLGRECRDARNVRRISIEMRDDNALDPTFERTAHRFEIRTEGRGVDIVESDPQAGESRGREEVDAGIRWERYDAFFWECQSQREDQRRRAAICECYGIRAESFF